MQSSSWLAVIAFAALCLAGSAEADVIWVDPNGTDSPDCGASTNACLSLQHAVDRASPGDTIFLDFASSYGPATIGREVIIQGVTGAGVFSPPGTPCITVDAAPLDTVTIRDLICDQGGTAQHGILFNSGQQLVMERITIRSGSDTCGLLFRPQAAKAAFELKNSTISGFIGPAGTAICSVPRDGGLAFGELARVNVESNRTGIRSSSLASNATSTIVVHESQVLFNIAAGIYSEGASSTVHLANTAVVRNNPGLSHASGGQIRSFGGNSVVINRPDGKFTSTDPTE